MEVEDGGCDESSVRQAADMTRSRQRRGTCRLPIAAAPTIR
jgi:hypothetical protein